MSNVASLPEQRETLMEQSVSNAAPEIAILIPCFNEELTIGDVIEQLRRELLRARFYVFDNNSTDRTAERARETGGILLRQTGRDEGDVVQGVLRQVDDDRSV